MVTTFLEINDQLVILQDSKNAPLDLAAILKNTSFQL